MNEPDISIKTVLHDLCMAYVDSCMTNAERAMQDARQSAANETKSSAGDKHETGRALLQLDQEKNARQLTEAKELKEKLLKIDPLLTSPIVSLGSVVLTSSGNFYISIAAGKIGTGGDFYFAISPASPIATKLMGLRSGDRIILNGRDYEIRYVF